MKIDISQTYVNNNYVPLSNFFPSGSISFTSKMSSNSTPAIFLGQSNFLVIFEVIVLFWQENHMTVSRILLTVIDKMDSDLLDA